jgi:hypothetical protein
MALTAEQRQKAIKWVAKKIFSEPGKTCDLDTVQIGAAVDAIDAWVDANQASFVAAIPAAFAAATNASEKGLLNIGVVGARQDITP